MSFLIKLDNFIKTQGDNHWGIYIFLVLDVILSKLYMSFITFVFVTTEVLYTFYEGLTWSNLYMSALLEIWFLTGFDGTYP